MGDLFESGRKPTGDELIAAAYLPLKGVSEELYRLTGVPGSPGPFSEALKQADFRTGEGSDTQTLRECYKLLRFGLNEAHSKFALTSKSQPELGKYSLRLEEGHPECSQGIKRIDDVRWRFVTVVGVNLERGGASQTAETNFDLTRFHPAPVPTLALLSVSKCMSKLDVSAYPIFCARSSDFIRPSDWLLRAISPGDGCSALGTLIYEAANSIAKQAQFGEGMAREAMRSGIEISERGLGLRIGPASEKYAVRFSTSQNAPLAPLQCQLIKDDKVYGASHSELAYLYRD